MDSFSCDECRAIYFELREACRAMGNAPGASSQQISEWVQRLNEEECARLRESSGLWKAWRRLQAHRSLTGHTQPVLPLPARAMTNLN